MALSSTLSFTTNTTTVVIVFITFLHLFYFLPTLYCSNHYPPPPPPPPPPPSSPSPSPDTATQGLLVVEKTRLGSTPPSCYNKCNKCHPCMAVQVPTLPNHGREQPSTAVAVTATSTHRDYYKSSSLGGGGGSESNNRYSNYKPLGWKCRCNGHFYNP